MGTKEQLIEKVSNVYREQEADNTKLKGEMAEIREKLKDKKIPYHDYVALERRLKMMDSEYSTQVFIARGISLAREALLDTKVDEESEVR